MKRNRDSFLKLLLLLAGPILIMTSNIYTQVEGPGKSQLEKNREKWELLPPEEKERMVRNYNRWKSLSPEKQRLILERYIFFQTLPREKQLELNEKIKTGFPLRPQPLLPKEISGRRDEKAPAKPMEKKPLERIERPDKIKMREPRPEKPIRPERIDRPEKPEHPEKPLRRQ